MKTWLPSSKRVTSQPVEPLGKRALTMGWSSRSRVYSAGGSRGAPSNAGDGLIDGDVGHYCCSCARVWGPLVGGWAALCAAIAAVTPVWVAVALHQPV